MSEGVARDAERGPDGFVAAVRCSSGVASRTRTPAHSYPGEHSSPSDLRKLADEFKRAAEALQTIGRSGRAMSYAPYRIAALHAVELYLNALLLHEGVAAKRLRGNGHDCALRARSAATFGLKLDERTLGHLQAMAGDREYLVARYAPEHCGQLTAITRVAATLRQVAERTTALIAKRPCRWKAGAVPPPPGLLRPDVHLHQIEQIVPPRIERLHPQPFI